MLILICTEELDFFPESAYSNWSLGPNLLILIGRLVE